MRKLFAKKPKPLIALYEWAPVVFFLREWIEFGSAIQVDISSAERLFCGCIFIILLDSSTDWRPLFCAVCHITFNSMKLSSVIFLYIVFMAKHINCWIYGFLIWPKRLPVTANPIVCRKSHIVCSIAINIELLPVRITRRCIMAPFSRLRKSIHTAMTDSNICVIPGHIKHICRTIFLCLHSSVLRIIHTNTDKAFKKRITWIVIQFIGVVCQLFARCHCDRPDVIYDRSDTNRI